jgi:uncharacterized membrane protein
MSKTFSISKAINTGWKTTTKNLGFMLGAVVVAIILPQVVSAMFKPDAGLVATLWAGAVWVYSVVVGMGILKISLKFVDGQKPELADLFSTYPLFFKYLVAYILFALGTLLGLILLVIPGIWFAVRYQYFAMAVVDKELGPIEALKESARLTEGNVWRLIGLGLAFFGVLILGLLALFLGVFVALPVVWVGYAWVYRQLSK